MGEERTPKQGRPLILIPPPLPRHEPCVNEYFAGKLGGQPFPCMLLEGLPLIPMNLPLPAAHLGTSQMRSRGESLGTAQKVLQRALSKKDSVGESYRGFMSEVKEELEVRSIVVFGSKNLAGSELHLHDTAPERHSDVALNSGTDTFRLRVNGRCPTSNNRLLCVFPNIHECRHRPLEIPNRRNNRSYISATCPDTLRRD